jgi:hypothetical protein
VIDWGDSYGRGLGSISILFGVRTALGCSPGNATALPADFFHIVDTVWLLSEDKLIKMSAKRRGGKMLVTILALFVFRGVVLPSCRPRVMRCFGFWAVDHD